MNIRTTNLEPNVFPQHRSANRPNFFAEKFNFSLKLNFGMKLQSEILEEETFITLKI